MTKEKESLTFYIPLKWALSVETEGKPAIEIGSYNGVTFRLLEDPRGRQNERVIVCFPTEQAATREDKVICVQC